MDWSGDFDWVTIDMRYLSTFSWYNPFEISATYATCVTSTISVLGRVDILVTYVNAGIDSMARFPSLSILNLNN